MRTRIDVMNLARTEARDLLTWLSEHLKTCQNENLGVYIKQSCSSGIGTNTWLRCGCGWEVDITDYSIW